MHYDSNAYFTALGARLARLRQARGYTQGELARKIGVSQQAVGAYEKGGRRVSVFTLVKLAGLFCVGIEALMTFGKPERVPKQRLSPRAKRHAERLQALSRTQQRFVVKIIDNLEQHNSATHRQR